MRKILFILGILITISGIFFALQGKGYITWPSSSFMVNQIEWGFYGCGIALVGLILMWVSRK